jgi:hypothetical protein
VEGGESRERQAEESRGEVEVLLRGRDGEGALGQVKPQKRAGVHL